MGQPYRARSRPRSADTRRLSITPSQAARLFARRDCARRGVFRHAWLHGVMEQRFAARSTEAVKSQLRSAGFDKQLVRAVVDRLATLVHRLEWKRAPSPWSDYGESCTYDEADRRAKQRSWRRPSGPGPAGWCSASVATTAPTAAWRRRTPATWSRWTRTRSSSTVSTGPCETKATRRSCLS